MTKRTSGDHWFIELLKRYGIFTVSVPVIISAVIIWAFAHFFSAPGEPVKVLWGLVEYTKMPNIGEKQQSIGITKRTPKDKIEVLQPATIEVVHGVTAAVENDIIDELRKKYELRELNPIEAGRGIGDTPVGSFFYIFLGYFRYRYEYPLNAKDKLMGGEVSRKKGSNNYLEIHHRKDGFFIIGFASVTDADHIRALTGAEDYKLTVSPKVWGSFTSLIQLPFTRIAASYPRDIEEIMVLDLTVR